VVRGEVAALGAAQGVIDLGRRKGPPDQGIAKADPPHARDAKLSNEKFFRQRAGRDRRGREGKARGPPVRLMGEDPELWSC